MIHVLHLPGFTPTSTNQLLGSVRGRCRLKRGDRERVAWEARQAGIPAAEGKRRLGLRVLLPKGQRATDPSNAIKSLEDALVQAGLLRGDSYRWVEPGPVVFARSLDGTTRETFVILEDLPRCG